MNYLEGEIGPSDKTQLQTKIHFYSKSGVVGCDMHENDAI